MFTKKEVFNIPNMLCYFRILLVPAFLYIYFTAETSEGHLISAFILVISSFSDFLDGYIARKYDMITELGQLVDPVADKLTQFVVACTLMYTYPAFVLLVIIIVLKDGMLLIGGYFIYKKTGKHLEGAELPGKIATAVFFMVSVLLVAFHIPGTFIASIMIYTTLTLMIIAMFYYAKGLYDMYLDNK